MILADQPLVTSDSIEKLIHAFDGDHRIVASHYANVIGAPALFGSEFFEDLMALEGDHGAGKWLRGRSEDVTAVEMSEARLDVDTPDDLTQIQRD